MNRTELLALARRVLTLPTAPYHEQAVREFVIGYCRDLGLPLESDRSGNVIAKWTGSKSPGRRKGKQAAAPLVFVAHMDHPGFEALDSNRAEFLGSVPKTLFKGGRARFYPSRLENRSCIRARIVRVDEPAWPKRKLVYLKAESRKPKADRCIRPGDFGMWDLPAFRLRGGKLRAVAIDDVLSVVVVLATLTEIARQKQRTHVWGVFTRAEEVGFHGAIELARAGHIPRNALVISMEMSSRRPWARIGHGPVVRMGDRMTTFDSETTFFLQEVARSIRERDASFRSQRALMDGGSCEATAFAAFGYRTGGLCLPLGNYHNIGRNVKPRTEYVSVRDLEQLLQLTLEASAQWGNFRSIGARLKARMERIRRGAPRQL